jgi:hypothetical protein
VQCARQLDIDEQDHHRLEGSCRQEEHEHRGNDVGCQVGSCEELGGLSSGAHYGFQELAGRVQDAWKPTEKNNEPEATARATVPL